MKIMKEILAVVFWLLIVALLVTPIGLIMKISQEEQAEFATPTVPELQQMAVGGIYQAEAESVIETFSLSGTFVSETYEYMELDYDTVKDLRWNVSSGSEIQVGTVLGTGSKGDVLSDREGIISQMHISADDCYIKVKLFSPVEFSCRVSSEYLPVLKLSKKLTCDGAAVTLTYASKQQNSDGTTNVRIRIDSAKYTYGQTTTLHIATGRSFDNTVRLPKRCVYQKATDGLWYVREVTADGYFLKEIEVEVIYSDGYNVYLKGINEGAYFDSGFQAIAGG